METEDDKLVLTSKSYWNYADSLRIGVVFNTESNQDLINITLRNTSKPLPPENK